MAIFDDFGKKVTQLGQEAVAKAKNMTDLAKLHSQMNEEEKKISDSYRKIGELFYSVRGSQELPEYQTLMDEVDAAKERIEEIRYQLQVAKGVAVCPECGAEVSANAAYCPNCGTKMPQPEPEGAAQEASAEPEGEAGEAETQNEAVESEAETQDEAMPEAETQDEVMPEAEVISEEKTAETGMETPEN